MEHGFSWYGATPLAGLIPIHVFHALVALLLIILVENAFKHGIEPAENQAYLHIDLYQRKNRLIFTCENSVEVQEKPGKPGIGLENLQRRLELLFPDRHTLHIYSEQGSYKTELSLELAEVSNLLPKVA